MNTLRRGLTVVWKIISCALFYSVTLILSRLAFHAVGLTPPRMPQQAEEAVAGLYLLAGSILLTLGLLPLVQRIQGRLSTRCMLVSAFLFLIFCVGNTIEDSIYSSTKGLMLMIPVLVLPSLALSVLMPLLFRIPEPLKHPATAREFFRRQTPLRWLARVALSALLFPVVYFIFGSIISPFVLDYYRAGVVDLALPLPRTIVAVELLRGFLFVIASLPVVISWQGSRREMVVYLGLAFFVLTATFGIVMAYELPATLRAIHSVEMLADAFLYAWLLVALLYEVTPIGRHVSIEE